ncbi:PAS domain S-box protein [Candidatus Poribacteria bacterium]|nr:PAS domain S-box protein [Candidatus Poribacteria bacterium]
MSRLLFLCTGNSSLSQIAEGFAREIAPNDVELLSAGVAAKGLHPKAIEVMAEAGIDISNQMPQTLANLDLFTFDVMIAFCNHTPENCPALLGSLGFVHWELPDPVETTANGEDLLSKFREVRDEIHQRVRTFFTDGYLAVLVARRRHLELILENLNDGIIAHDNHRYIFYFNRAAEMITGYRREEVLGRDCYSVFQGGFCGGKCSFRERVPQFEHLHYSIDITAKEGEQRRVEMSAIPMKDDSGKAVGCLTSFRDITRLLELEHRLGEMQQFSGIIGNHPTMLNVFDLIRHLATLDVPVLIQGESGTGKELVAAAIHNEGKRADKHFVPVNCGALPAGTLESELFGHVRGAFTGAIRDKKGRFELADGGTIFLDEVGELSPEAQVKLLRVLQDGTFERVGGETTIKVDVRIISATNKDLKREVALGKFREDLYYRLCVVPINLPPLREKKTDIPLLAEHFLQRAVAEAGREKVLLSHEALAVMMDYHWPGNVRELQNAIQYALVKCQGNIIRPLHLPDTILSQLIKARSKKRHRKRKLEFTAVQGALREAEGNKVKAAKLLRVSRATLYRFISDTKG